MISIVKNNRPQVEEFINSCYKDSFGAYLNSFLDNLYEFKINDILVGAFGVSSAKNHKLYLEQYFDIPIELVIGDIFNTTNINRQDIIEIGNLCTKKAGLTKIMMLELAQDIYNKNIKYVVLTATKQVQNILINMGLDIKKIGDAKQTMLTDMKTNWGTYYQTNPEIFVINVEKNIKLLEK